MNRKDRHATAEGLFSGVFLRCLRGASLFRSPKSRFRGNGGPSSTLFSRGCGLSNQLGSLAGLTILATTIVPVSAALGLIQTSAAPQNFTRADAESCSKKVERLESFAADANLNKRQTTRFSQQEINSYLALDLSSNYSPSLKSLEFIFTEGKIEGDAIIDFDRLGMSTTKLLSKLMASMFSGVHTLSARGRLIADQGKANFQLEDAKFDNTGLPNFLVEEIITAVGRKQRPPFDPLQPSQMPYRIEKVEIHKGYIMVFQ